MTKRDIRIDTERCAAKAVGGDHGIRPRELHAIEPLVIDAHETLRRERTKRIYGFYDLYEDAKVFGDIRRTAREFLKKRPENFVVLAIGGSALGTTALVTALKPPYYNLLSAEERQGKPRVFVMDNIDPVTFAAMLRLCPPEKTIFNVISKSGDTAETVTQSMIVVKILEDAVGRGRLKEHMVVTTNPPNAPKKSLLRAAAREYGLKTFTVPLNVGGRFCVFSPVGMFPAAMLGMDLDALREGCRGMDRRCQKPDLDSNPAYRRAAIQYLADTWKGKVMSVMMPYADALRDVADWYRQLWAESLGKRLSLDEDEVFVGQTPIKSLGVTDQHSQVQLYREGPNNKIFNIIEVENFDEELLIPNALKGIRELDYLRGKTMNQLMAAELRATMEALLKSDRPVSRIIVPRVDAYTVAQLLYMLEIETAMAGRLYNVQTFDQPGVEDIKNITRASMAALKPRVSGLG